MATVADETAVAPGRAGLRHLTMTLLGDLGYAIETA
jgi:hypothetical protein